MDISTTPVADEKGTLSANASQNKKVNATDTFAATIKQPIHPSLEAQSSFFSRVMNLWFSSLVSKGWKHPLEMEDLYRIDDQQQSLILVEAFESLLAKANSNPANSKQDGRQRKTVLKAFLYMYRWFPVWGICKIIADICSSTTAYMMKDLLSAIIASQQQVPSSGYTAFGYAAGFFLLTCTASILNASIFSYSSKIAVGAKGMLTTAIYRKSLRLNGVGRAKFSSGKLLNIVATDIGRIEQTINQFEMTWTAPFFFITTIVLLLFIIGVAGLAGVAFILICIPFQGIMIRKLMQHRGLIAPVTDKRIKLSTEILQGIRIIKYFSWESQFFKNVSDIRDKEELILVKHAAFVRSVISCLGFAIPAISASITFLVYGSMNSSLAPTTIFSTLALFNQLRQHVMWLPLQVSVLGDSFISFRRLQELFDAPEVEFSPTIDPAAKYGVEISNGEFTWESETITVAMPSSEFIQTDVNFILPQPTSNQQQQSTLRNITLACPRGGLTCIVGAVGAGKSSLLAALIAELKCISGRVVFSGAVGYCSQQAWIVNASVRENIVFGRPYDAARYKAVVSAACLAPDFAILPNSDMSEIGERGINLSGGQKQRISLARLFYTDHDIALLDDPLSAVDAHVGRRIFEDGICGVLKNKTRVLVTHQLHHVPSSDWIVFMKSGEIAEQGTYADLIQNDGEFAKLMAEYGGEKGSDDEDGDTEPIVDFNGGNDLKIEDIAIDLRNMKKNFETEQDEVQLSKEEKTVAQMQVESKKTGKLSSSTLLTYFRSTGSNLFLIITIFSLAFTQATRLANDMWLVEWSENTYPSFSKNGYMAMYAGLSVLQSVSLLSYSLLFAIGGIAASKSLHEKILKRIMQYQTPVGRIINRLSHDIDYVDNSIYDGMRLLFYSVLQVVSAFCLVAYITKGLFLAVLVPTIAIYIAVQTFYRTTSREIKRIESVSRSPLYAHISECINGLSTIRAYNDQARFITKTHTLVDANSSPMYLLLIGQRWIQFRLDMLGNVLVFAVALYAAGMRTTINPSQIGLALSYLLQTTALLNMVVFQLVEVEIQLNAVERLVEYMDLPIEDQFGEPAPHSSWPDRGDIQFRNVQMRYQPNLPLVLKGVNVEIKGGEKIGVVGRTGSGKSSLMQALFRIVDLAGGEITIDGVDISKLRLHDLRTSLAIIPQDPVLFSGTLRSNLDPINLFSDDQIWNVLERCGMKEAVAEMEGKLDCILVENAENVSVGQRQLLCLARACLQKPKIIVLDECTASVDMKTDALIQKTIQEEFKDATTLTIAHRLNTIINSSKILVLGGGKVLEFDTPRKLMIDNEDSHFRKMVAETGEANAIFLQSLVI
ncbi:Multidrug resistance-associated protein 1 [Physocladia obscura]|uniref:Multidrug resistance-associated protein 1 n=1 Tax=Physocladia obscura TaxID=109957 RepID=A0AAD5SYY3_9FUNG|nr:Multidrug resistance-associated protein 1 [Physocladia obscura]